MTDRTDLDIDYFRKRLFARREELQSLIAGAEASAGPVELDQTRVGRLSRMDALQSQAMAQETKRRRRQEIERIIAALRRIEEGEYGYCVRSGDPIPVERLEIDPAAAVLARPAKQIDQE